MSSEQRSSSGVRNLLAVFENHENNSHSPDRGRSPSGSDVSGRRNNTSPAIGNRNVRANFVSVEKGGYTMDTVRRESGTQDKLATETLQRTISEGIDGKISVPAHGMTAADASISALQSSTQPAGLASISQPMALPDRELQSEHQEKLTSAVEDEEAELRPADVKDVSAVSEGDAIAEATNNPKRPNRGSAIGSRANGLSQPTASSAAKTSKPSRPSTSRPSMGLTSKAPTNVKSTAPKPSSQKTSSRTSIGPVRTTAERLAELAKPSANRVAKPAPTSPSQTSPTSKAGRRSPTRPVALPSHLTAPTASSAAKHEPDTEVSKTNKHVTSSKPIPAHLLAPTASSAAKHEADASSATTATSSRSAVKLPIRNRTSTSGSAASKQATSSRTSLASRSSLSGGTSNRTDAVRSAGATASKVNTSESFLARMSKPTTASSSKTHAKSEALSPVEATTNQTSSSSTKSKRPSAANKSKKIADSTEQNSTIDPASVESDIKALVEQEISSTKIEDPEPNVEPEPPIAVSGLASTGAPTVLDQPLVEAQQPADELAAPLILSDADKPIPSIEHEEAPVDQQIVEPITTNLPSESFDTIETPFKREYNGSPLGMPNSEAEQRRMEETPQFEGSSIR